MWECITKKDEADKGVEFSHFGLSQRVDIGSSGHEVINRLWFEQCTLTAIEC